jgi:hypothetical protein
MPVVSGNQSAAMNNASHFTKMFIGIVSNTGLTLSIFLLSFHLLIFSIVDDLQNLPGKNLASFCVALILEYTSTLLSSVLENQACYINEIAAYYFIMASAFWMLTMSYDVWQTLRSTTNGLLIAGGRQCKKFICYSLFSWLMPGLLTTLVFFVLPRIFEHFDLAYQDFDQKNCTFQQTDKMYVFVTTVFGTILLLNTLFFVSSIYYIFSTQVAVTKKSNKNNAYITQFRLYGRLAIIMGVTWTAEFIINYSKFHRPYFKTSNISSSKTLFLSLAGRIQPWIRSRYHSKILILEQKTRLKGLGKIQYFEV